MYQHPLTHGRKIVRKQTQIDLPSNARHLHQRATLFDRKKLHNFGRNRETHSYIVLMPIYRLRSGNSEIAVTVSAASTKNFNTFPPPLEHSSSRRFMQT